MTTWSLSKSWIWTLALLAAFLVLLLGWHDAGITQLVLLVLGVSALITLALSVQALQLRLRRHD